MTRTSRGNQLFIDSPDDASDNQARGFFPLYSPDALRLGDRLIFVDRDPPEPAAVFDIELKDGSVVSVYFQALSGTWRMTSDELAARTALVLDARQSTAPASADSREASSRTFRASLHSPTLALPPFAVATAWLGDRLLFIDRDPPEPATIVDILLADGPARRFVLQMSSGWEEMDATELAARKALALGRGDAANPPSAV